MTPGSIRSRRTAAPAPATADPAAEQVEQEALVGEQGEQEEREEV